MDTSDIPDGPVLLLTGTSVPVTAAIAWAFAQCQPCVVLAGADDGEEPR